MLACGCFLRISKSSLIINSWSLQITPAILSAFLHTVGPLVNVDGDGTGCLRPTWVLHLPPWTMLMPSPIGKSHIPEGLYNTVKACSHQSSLLFADPGIPWKSGPFLQTVYDSHLLAMWSWRVLNPLWTSFLDHVLIYCPPQRAFTYQSGWKAEDSGTGPVSTLSFSSGLWSWESHCVLLEDLCPWAQIGGVPWSEYGQGSPLENLTAFPFPEVHAACQMVIELLLCTRWRYPHGLLPHEAYSWEQRCPKETDVQPHLYDHIF